MTESQLAALTDRIEQNEPKWLQTGASGLLPIVGALALTLWTLIGTPSSISTLVLFGPLVITPLVLRLADDPALGPLSSVLPWLRMFNLPVGLLAILAASTNSGFISFLLGLPLLVVSIRIGLVGFLRFLSRPSVTEPSIGLDLALGLAGVSGSMVFTAVVGIGTIRSGRAAVALAICGVALPAVSAVLSTIHQTRRLGTLSAGLSAVAAAAFIVGGPTAFLAGSCLMALVVFPVARALASTETENPIQRLQQAAALPLGLGVIAGLYATASDRFDLGLFGGKWPLQVGIALAVLGVTAALGTANLLSQPSQLSEDDLPRIHTKIHLGPVSRTHLRRLHATASRTEATPVPGLLAGDLRSGYREQSWSVPVSDFENSCEALWAWAGHEEAGVTLEPERPRIAVGETVAMAIPFGPLTVTAACRIVSITDQPDSYGFTYWPLDHHPFTGQETFVIQRTPNGAKATITAISKPSIIASAFLPPISRTLHTSLANRCLEGIGEADAAEIDERMTSLVSSLDSREFPVTREAVMSERAISLPSELATDVEPPRSALEELFEQPFDGPSYDPESGTYYEPNSPPEKP